VLRLTGVIGDAAEPALAAQLHALEHRGRVERVTLRPEDTARRRLRVMTDRGSECAIILGRSERLSHGAVLLLEPERAVLVRVDAAAWFRLEARDRAAAIELGYLAGNLHWKVRFEGEALWVRLDGDAAFYRARLAPLLRSQRIALTLSTAAPEATGAHEHHEHHEHGQDHDGHTHDPPHVHDHVHIHPHAGEKRA
jgi:urease accessory protein